ncbi:MAG: glycosyltransferase family 2 protein, partial [Acidimicrobiales bacterium]
MTLTRPRVLLAITVYNGRAFVPATLRSALRIDRSEADVDVVVLDDASPEPGFSDELRGLCAELGAGYYRSPRNLGIVRNVNLGLLQAVDGGYDHVIVSNSDVLYPANVVTSLLRVVATDPAIGSVTAWSNNVSAYSLPNDDPDRHLDQDAVDWVSTALARQFGGTAIDVPAGISFCILVPTEVVRHVGFMDPVFGRGYCEETDWSRRSLARGYRIVLGPSAFVYHAGRGSTLAAGLVAGGHTSDPAKERIIDLRYPDFRRSVYDFLDSGVLEVTRTMALRRILADAARDFGYSVHLGWIDRVPSDTDMVRCMVDAGPAGPGVEASWRGFRVGVEVDPAAPAAGIRRALGERLLGEDIFDRPLGGAE